MRLAGGPTSSAIRLPAKCLSRLRKRTGREEYQRGILRQDGKGVFTVLPVTGQDSHQLASASQSNCFIVLNQDCDGVMAGEIVLVEPLHLNIELND